MGESSKQAVGNRQEEKRRDGGNQEL